MALYTSSHTGAEIDAAITAALAGYAPAGTYDSLAALTAAISAGNSSVYLTADNNKWNYWNGSAWTAGGTYTGASASVAVGTVTTGDAGTDASVANSGTETAAVFDFAIPRGAKGDKGDAAATIEVGTVTTGDPGTSASVENSGTSSAVVLDFTIPRGNTGAAGVPGKSVTSVVRTSGTGAAGTTDTYTITYSDSSTSTFNVYNGADGTGSGDMSKSVYDTDNDGVVDSAETLLGLTATISELNFIHGLTSSVQSQLNAKLPLAGGTMTGAINEALVQSMALASTMAIGAAAGNYIIVTAGTGPITAFDSITMGARRFLRFAVAATITYNGTTMLLPGAADLSVSAGDVLEFVSGGSGVWRCVNIQPWGTWPVSFGGTGANTAAGARANLGVDAALGRSTAVTAADTNYTSYMARGEGLASADTTPSNNGQICWTYV